MPVNAFRVQNVLCTASHPTPGGTRGVVISLLQMRGLGLREVKLISKGCRGRIQTWTGLSYSQTAVLPTTNCTQGKDDGRLKKITHEEGFIGSTLFLFLNFLFIDFRQTKEGQKERKTLICCSTYWCIHWLILICALTGDRTCNLGISRRCSHPRSHPARARLYSVFSNWGDIRL